MPLSVATSLLTGFYLAAGQPQLLSTAAHNLLYGMDLTAVMSSTMQPTSAGNCPRASAYLLTRDEDPLSVDTQKLFGGSKNAPRNPPPEMSQKCGSVSAISITRDEFSSLPVSTMPIRVPIHDFRISSRFGPRTHPVYGRVRLHSGVDFAAQIGRQVMASGSGEITFVGTMRGYGLTVDIDHGRGIVTRYAHLSRIADGLTAQSFVNAGQIIGNVGTTGTVSGPNLHYEMRIGGNPVEPGIYRSLPGVTPASAQDMATAIASPF